jgi:hypothetical protein
VLYDSVKIVKDMPSAIISLRIKASGKINPSTFAIPFGVEKINVNVTKKVRIETKPPTSPP